MKIINRQARFQYRVIETLEAGIVLTGAEVKSVRNQRVDLAAGFARIQKSELYLKNVMIFPYNGQTAEEYNPRRDRKLLIHRRQINTLTGKLSQGSFTLIPLSIYDQHNLIKVELGLVESKTKIDKRRQIKQRDEDRQLERDLRKIKVEE